MTLFQVCGERWESPTSPDVIQVLAPTTHWYLFFLVDVRFCLSLPSRLEVFRPRLDRVSRAAFQDGRGHSQPQWAWPPLRKCQWLPRPVLPPRWRVPGLRPNLCGSFPALGSLLELIRVSRGQMLT